MTTISLAWSLLTEGSHINTSRISLWENKVAVLSFIWHLGVSRFANFSNAHQTSLGIPTLEHKKF